MKNLLVWALAAWLVPSAYSETRVGVSIGINQPGVYGRIDIGDVPPVALVMPQPVVIAPAPYYAERRPIYLYVPSAHQRDWRRYCSHYGACGQQTYFVRETWVRDRYQHDHPGWDRGHARGRGHDRHGDRDHRRGEGHRHGHGHGHGHGHDD